MSGGGGRRRGLRVPTVFMFEPKMPEKSDENDTRIEGQYTRLILKRTMTLFFLVVFSIPFFESTTYR